MSVQAPFWTAADAAELEVLVDMLTRSDEAERHRESCRACRPCPIYAAWKKHKAGCAACLGDAPLTHGPPCEEHARFIAHGGACLPCNLCPHMQRAIRLVVAWREQRLLASKAAWLRRLEDEREAA